MSMMQMLLGAGGSGAETIADWFSVKTYTGASTGITVDNGLDMVGKEGLIWMKSRGSGSHGLIGSKGSTGGAWYGWLDSGGTSGDASSTSNLVTVTSSGFEHNSGSTFINDTGVNYVSWTFLKAEKFFDIIEYEGSAPNEQTISHGLGCLPGMIIVKKYDTYGTARNWCVYHKHMDDPVSKNDIMHLNTHDNKATDTAAWANTDPTTTTFKVDNQDETNDASRKYVAYLFANDEDYIKCGSYTGTYSAGSAGPAVNLGWEPQFVLIKQSDGTANTSSTNWFMFDNQRLYNVSGTNYPSKLWANYTDGEHGAAYISFTSTGFTVDPLGQGYGGITYPAGDNYIYMAIRKPD